MAFYHFFVDNDRHTETVIEAINFLPKQLLKVVGKFSK